MPKPKTNKKEKKENIKINKENESSLVEFTQRPLPSDQELNNFDDFIKEEVKEEEINNSLSEIYQDENGDVVNVKKLVIKKKHGYFFWLFTVFFILVFLAGAAYGAYYFYYLQGDPDARAVELAITSKSEVMAGEEFFYIVNFKNLDRVDINNIEIKLTYPENFVFLDSQPAANEKNDYWSFELLPPNKSKEIKVKGKLIGKTDQTNIILADMNYIPSNFSSEFKKVTSFENTIRDSGIELSLVSASSFLVGEESDIIIKYKTSEKNYLNNFRLTAESFIGDSLDQAENIEFIKINSQGDIQPKQIKPGVWLISDITKEERELKIKFKIKEKITESQEIVLKFDNLVGDEADGQYYLFTEEKINFEVIKSDLNLGLIINSSQTDQGISFDQQLAYLITYSNKGEAEMNDVIIMAVLESDFLDWAALSDKNNGAIDNNTISWSKEEIPELKNIAKNKEGSIDFTIKVKPMGEIDLNKDYQVKSYVQYSVGASEDSPDEIEISEDKRSNTIINKINSDLKLTEQVRYFNEDNITVGLGPLPPKVGETTSYKVYWTVTNNLHELNDLQVLVDLPPYVNWDNKNTSSLSNLEYNSESHKIIWRIGRLPVTVNKAEAEFSISITPSETDKNKIMVLMPGSFVQAIDKETKAAINKIGGVKTTKLEDDEIAETDGRVVE